jgi:hypothetical protein
LVSGSVAAQEIRRCPHRARRRQLGASLLGPGLLCLEQRATTATDSNRFGTRVDRCSWDDGDGITSC